jgi:hypothetical protein
VIILSGVLVVVAIALLVTGIVTGNTGHEIAGLEDQKLIYISIGVSIVSALCLAIGVFLRRKELFGTAPETSVKRSASRSGRTARPAKAKARVGAGDETPVPVASATATDVPADTSVFVVPGRKRYHLETCRQLAGRDKEELTFVEAREEGFTACTACLPDTALAARAALTETESAAPAADDDAQTTESIEALPDPRRSDDTAPVTRTDLPAVRRLDDDEPEPAAESPAAAEARESSTAETGPSTDTAVLDDLTETSEAPSEPATERPSARGRSLFEPLERDEEDTAAEGASRDEDAVAAPEPGEPEDTSAEPHEPEPRSDERSEPEDLPEPEPEAAEPADTSGTPTGTSFGDDTEEATGDAAETATGDTAPPADTDEDTDTDHEAEAAETDDAGDRPGSADDDTEDATGDAPTSEGLPFVRILSGTKRYHRPDCALIEDIAADADDMETLSPAEAKDRGCTPCLVCQPDKDSSDDRY